MVNNCVVVDTKVCWKAKLRYFRFPSATHIMGNGGKEGKLHAKKRF